MHCSSLVLCARLTSVQIGESRGAWRRIPNAYRSRNGRCGARTCHRLWRRLRVRIGIDHHHHSAAPTTSPCLDTTLGVCRVADAGIRHITLTRAGANGLALDPASGLVYVVINGATSPWCSDVGNIAPSLAIVDPRAGREVRLVNTGEGPVWPLVDPRRNKVFVASSGGAGTVAVHDPATGALERSFVLGGRPHDLGLDPSGSNMLVSNTFDRSQTFVSLVNVDTGAVATPIAVAELPHKVVVDERGRIGYAVSLGSGRITSVDLASGARLREYSSGPIPQTSAMAYSPSRRRLYVGKTGGSTPSSGTTIVAVDVDSGSIVGEVGTFTPGSPIATRPWGGFGLDDANGLLYSAMGNTNWSRSSTSPPCDRWPCSRWMHVHGPSRWMSHAASDTSRATRRPR